MVGAYAASKCRIDQHPYRTPTIDAAAPVRKPGQAIERAKSAGAKGWFIKPVKPEMLLMAINKLAR